MTTELRSWASDTALRTFYEHPRLGEQEVPVGLMALLRNRRLFRNVRWQEYVPDDQADREDADDLDTAEAAASLPANGRQDQHVIMVDIDHDARLVEDPLGRYLEVILEEDDFSGPFVGPDASVTFRGERRWVRLPLPRDVGAWLIPSTQAGHWHLYVDVAWTFDRVMRLLDEWVEADVVEPGYAAVSRKRGFTALRLPWVAKEDAAAALEPVDKAIDTVNALIAADPF